MKIRAVILAGGEGTRLGVLTAKRTKPAVPFAGKYRIIDFPLSNCVNSNIFDVMIVAQYRPHSLIDHIGAGGPWDLNREFTGGVQIFTPYRARASGWFIGTADAVQQNYAFIKNSNPDLVLILSGDHVYAMDFDAMIKYHLAHNAGLTLATIRVPLEECSRFGIVGIDEEMRVTSFVEKPANPPSTLANMGVYLFNAKLLDEVLWEDSIRKDSSHDFGKDILPRLISAGEERIFAFPYDGYWVDVGTVSSYWQAHMDLLNDPPPFDLYNRNWIIHTRTEERPPLKVYDSAVVENSLLCNGCIIEPGARVTRSILSPGVTIRAGAVVEESILLTDTVVEAGAHLTRTVMDKRTRAGANSHIGGLSDELMIAMVGKNAHIPPGVIIEPGAQVGPDVIESDFSTDRVKSGEFLQTRRLPNEI